MKVLVVHNRYRSAAPSGEDAAVDAEGALLERNGVRVVRYERRNDDIVAGAGAAVETVWSASARRELASLLRRERPSIAHLHNLWYRISPSAYAACRDAGVPVVQTLHNFRLCCANGLLLRGGRPCEECVGRPPWRAALHGCFRGSRAATAPIALAQWVHARRSRADRYVALSGFARERFVAAGLPAGRIVVKPNFLADPPAPRQGAGEGALFVGRLAPEKGVVTLLAAAGGPGHAGFRLDIVGDGALLAAVDAAAAASGGRVRAAGPLSRAACVEAMGRARCVVVPSICYENFPLAVVEAFACGTPVVASRLGALAEIVEDGRTGLLVTAGDAAELSGALDWMNAHPEESEKMGRAARAVFEERYTAEKNFAQLLDIYRDFV